jgi:hypothetical protein
MITCAPAISFAVTLIQALRRAYTDPLFLSLSLNSETDSIIMRNVKSVVL